MGAIAVVSCNTYRRKTCSPENNALRLCPLIDIRDIPGVLDGVVFAGLRLTQQRPLVGAQDAKFAHVDGDPIVLKDATGIARVRVPCPVGITDAAGVKEGDESALPYAGGIVARGAPSEFSQKHGCDIVCLQVSPVFLPDDRQVVRKVRCAKPLLWVDLGPVVVRRIDEFVRLREGYRKHLGTLKVTAPPVEVTMILLDAFHDDKPLWIDGQDGVAHPLGSHAPVCAGIAVAPGCGAVWLVGQVSADDGVIAPVVAGKYDPIIEPAALGALGGVT